MSLTIIDRAGIYRIIAIVITMTLAANLNMLYWIGSDVNASAPPPDDAKNGLQIIDGDWHVYGKMNYSDEIIELNGNLIIHNDAVLEFRNVTLMMNATDKMQIYYIEIMTDAEFYVLDGDDDPATKGDASNITDSIYDYDNLRANNTDFRYGIRVRQDGYLEVRNSDIREAGQPLGTEDFGIYVSHGKVIMRNATIRNSHYPILFYSSNEYTDKRLVIDNTTIDRCYYGIQIERLNNLEIKYSHFSNIDYQAMYSYFSDNIHIFNSTFINISKFSNYVIEVYYAKNARLSGNSFNKLYYGPYFSAGSNIRFDNNSVENTSSYGFYDRASSNDYHYINDNYFNNIVGIAVYLDRVYNGFVINNVFNNTISTTIYSQNSNNIKIENNRQTYHQGYFIQSYYDNNLLVLNNTINSSSGPDFTMYFETARNLKVEDNLIYGAYSGIYLSYCYEGIEVNNNIILGRTNLANTYGINLYRTGSVHMENNIIVTFMYGLYAYYGSWYNPDKPNEMLEGLIKKCVNSVYIYRETNLDMFNVSFNISRMNFHASDFGSEVNVYFGVHVYVYDLKGPVGGAIVGAFNKTKDLVAAKFTDKTGWAKDLYALNGTYTRTTTDFFSPFNFTVNISGSIGFAPSEYEINSWRNVFVYFDFDTFPSSPQNLRYKVNYSSVELSWDAFVSDLDSYKVFRNNSAGGWDLMDKVITPASGARQVWTDVDNATRLVEFRYKIHHIDSIGQEGINDNIVIFNDWVIVDTVTIGNRTIDLNGSLIVETGGDLTLENVSLYMRGTPGVMEIERIEVRTNGTLWITDLDGDNETTSDMSFVNASKEMGSYRMILRPDSEMRIENSWIQNSSNPNDVYPFSNCVVLVKDAFVEILNSTIIIEEVGIILEDSNGSTIWGNNFDNNGSTNYYVAVYIRDSIDILVGTNTFNRSFDSEIYVYESEDIGIFNNTIQGEWGTGIYASENSDMHILNNTILGTSTGIYIRDSDDVTIDGTNLTDFDGTGIYVDSTIGLTINYNHIHDSPDGNEGIVVYDSDDITIAFNNITNLNPSWSTAIGISEFNSLIVGFNNISYVVAGMEIDNWGNDYPTGDILIMNNTVSNPYSDFSFGVSLQNSNDAAFFNNTISDFYICLLMDTSYRVYIANNTISGGLIGLGQNGGEDNYYYGNVFWDNHYTMYFIWGALATVHNNTILGTPPYTIYVNESAEVMLINPFFNLTKMYVSDKTCKVHIQWTFDLQVNDQFGQPQKDIIVRVRNIYGTILRDASTDPKGKVYNVLVNVRTQLYDSNLTYTPHKFEATLGNHSGTLVQAVNSMSTVTMELDNSAPSAYNILINPLTPYTKDALQLNYLFTDPEYDTNIGTIIKWYKNDIYEPALDNFTSVPSQYTKKGDYWYCKITPYDGADYGIESTSMYAFIYNSKPTASGIAITPQNPSSTEDLAVEYTFTDDDDDDEELGTVFRWYVKEGLDFTLKHTTSIPELNHSRVQKGEEWKVSVEPKDGESAGDEIFSLSIIVGNTPPSVENVKVTPEKPRSVENITVEYDFIDVDLDTEDGTLFQWYKIPSGSQNFISTGHTNKTVSADQLAKGEVWKCTVTPGDGLNQGSTVESLVVTIENTAPSIYNLKIMPDEPMTDYELWVEYDFTDRDDDNENDTVYEWLIKSGEILLRTGLKVKNLPSLFTAKGDEWVCEVTPFDGYTYGDPVFSPAIKIDNSPPVVSDLTISPVGPKTLDTLVANYDYNDENNDVEAGTQIFWYRDGQRVDELNDRTTVPPEYTSKGEKWYFSVIPNDNFIAGQEQSSPEISILNSAPEARMPELTNLFPRGDDDLHITFEYYDPDGDTNNGTEILWYKDGENQSEFDDMIVIPSSATEKDQTWYYEIRVFDGTDTSGYNESFPVIIRNARPVIISFVPAQKNIVFNETESFEFSVVVEDGDGDVLFYQWVLENQLTKEVKTLGEDPFLNLVTEYDDAGTYVLSVIIQDWGVNSFKISHDWNVVILNNNRLPRITVTEPEDDNQTIREDKSLRFSISESDPDSEDTQSIKWLFDGIEVEPARGQKIYTFDPEETDVGSHTVSAVVNDTHDEKVKTWNVTVKALDDERDLIYGMTWDQWSVILQVIVITFTGIFASFGFLKLRKKKGVLQDYMRRIEAPMKNWDENPDKSEIDLIESAQVIDSDYKAGQIEDLHYFLLSRQVKENLREIRQDRVGSAFSYLPEETQKEIGKMLEDGKITENEYKTFLDILEETPGLTDIQRQEITSQMQQWRMMDKEAEDKRKALDAFEKQPNKK